MKYKARKYFPSGSYIDIELDGNKKLGKHFWTYELVNKSAKDEIKLEIYPESEVFIQMTDELREALGAYSPNSAYRTRSFNNSLPDADPNSAHLYLCAEDIPRKGNYDNLVLVRNTWKSICKKRNIKGAINYYDTYIHIEAFSDKWYGQKSDFVVRDKRKKK